jgi:hypothetical protein
VPTSGASCKRPAKAVKPTSSSAPSRYQMFRLLERPRPFASRVRAERKRKISTGSAFSSFDNDEREREREKSYCVIFCPAAAAQANKLLKRFVLERKEPKVKEADGPFDLPAQLN